MQGMIKTAYGSRSQILAVVDPQVSFGCIVSATGVTANAEGKKIVKAGTPLYGSLLKRDTAFSTTASSDTECVGALLHDVDVTGGNNNGTCLNFGWINTKRLDADVLALWTDTVKTALKAKVTLVTA